MCIYHVVCVFPYIYIYISIYTYMCIIIRLFIYIYVYICTYLHIALVHPYVYTSRCICIHISLYICRCIFLYFNIHQTYRNFCLYLLRYVDLRKLFLNFRGHVPHNKSGCVRFWKQKLFSSFRYSIQPARSWPVVFPVRIVIGEGDEAKPLLISQHF